MCQTPLLQPLQFAVFNRCQTHTLESLIFKDIAAVKLVFNNVDKNKGKENRGQKKASWIGRTFIELSFRFFQLILESFSKYWIGF
jgi:hypothetical protein